MEFLGKLDSTRKETYGFNSCKCPPIVDELSDFENELVLLVKNIEFRNINNNFQKTLNDDIERINTTEKVLVKADKSRNIYQLDENDYKKYLRENITKTYKKSNKKRLNAVNKQAKKIAEKLNIDDRIEKIQETEAIDFTREKVEITDTDISITMQARKTLLFHEGVPWVKRSDNEDFDVPMGSYDGAEVC